MKRTELKQLIKEEILKLNEKQYTSKGEIFTAYLKNELSYEEMEKLAGGSKNVATKQELTSFLKNNFMIELQAEEYGISKSELIKKIKELINKI